MPRNVSRGFFGSLLILFAASFEANSADKTPKESAATTAARKQVEAALRAEAAGDNDRRAELLANAIQTAPTMPEANWHSARVHVGGRWLALAEAEQQAASDAQLSEYRRLRDEAGENPKLIRGLARWSVKNNWDDRARLHYAQLLAARGADLDAREEAIKRLGMHYISGNWVTATDLADQQRKAKAMEDALTKWRPRLKRLQMSIDGSDPVRRDSAMRELEELADPQVIPVLESFLVDGGDWFQERAVKRLTKFPQCEATIALAHYAVLSSYSAARDAATTALHDRTVFEYCPLLLGALTAPLEARYQIAEGRGGRILSRYAVRQQTPAVDRTAVMDTITLPALVGPAPPRGPESAVLRQERIAQVATLWLNMQNVASRIAEANATARSNNHRVVDVLRQATGQQFGDDPQQWWDWWQDYNQKWWPQVSQYLYDQEQRVYPVFIYPTTGVRHSCFVAGTLVRTEGGLTPIEQIKPGDRVLSQDQDTGELSYKLVSASTVRPPGSLLRIRAGSNVIDTTPGHPFWVSGSGWRMAKELRTGDRLHALDGPAQIDQIDELPKPQVAYNLIVQDFNSYFVGREGLLVHDNEFRKPTHAIVPGLAEELAATAKK